jgi:hypothetical protein
MKNLILLALFCFSYVTFAQSYSSKGNTQSYMVLANGNVQIIKSFYDGENTSYTNSYIFLMEGYVNKIKSNYFLDERNIIFTVTQDGYVYEKFGYKIDDKIKYFGGTFFITKKGSLYIVRADGLIYEYNDMEEFKKVKVLGGNYFITRDNRVFVVTSDGTYAEKTEYFQHKARDVKEKGHNYFITRDGTVYTAGEEVEMKVDNNGVSTGKPALDNNGNMQYYSVLYTAGPVNADQIKTVGGNFFIDDFGHIHTISANGQFDRGVVGRKVKVIVGDHDFSAEEPLKVGTNYIVYPGNQIIMIDNLGYFHHLGKSYQEVEKTNTDF